jgi:hypothetical protein
MSSTAAAAAAVADGEAGGEAGGVLSEEEDAEEVAHGVADVAVAGAGAGAGAAAAVGAVAVVAAPAAASGGAVVGLWAAAAQVGDAGGEAIADMEGRRREIKREQDLLSRALFNEQRKRARLLARAQGLSDSDLLSIVGARAAAKAKAAAKAAAKANAMLAPRRSLARRRQHRSARAPCGGAGGGRSGIDQAERRAGAVWAVGAVRAVSYVVSRSVTQSAIQPVAQSLSQFASRQVTQPLSRPSARLPRAVYQSLCGRWATQPLGHARPVKSLGRSCTRSGAPRAQALARACSHRLSDSFAQ